METSLSVSDGMCSSSSAGTSPDPSPASSPGPRRQQQVPGLRLSLGGLAAPSGAGSKVPGLSLGGPAWPGGDAPPTARPGAARPPAATVAEVSLLSPAFTLCGPEAGDLEASCTARLGVAPQRLRFFQLVEAPRDLRQLQAQGCTRVVVEGAGSSEWLGWGERTRSGDAAGPEAGAAERRSPPALLRRLLAASAGGDGGRERGHQAASRREQH